MVHFVLNTNMMFIQNRAAFLALPTRKYSPEERISLLGWLPVHLMVEKASLCLLHKMLSEQSIPYFAKLIGSSRRRYYDPIPSYDQSLGRLLQRSFLPRTATRFNSLPEDLRKCNQKRFKKLLVPYLRANPSVAWSQEHTHWPKVQSFSLFGLLTKTSHNKEETNTNLFDEMNNKGGHNIF